MLSTGSVLGDFRVEGEVGRGGMGVVYRAVQVSLGRPVALKVIAGALADNVGFRERFVRESRLAASLDHPNVIPVYAAGEDDGVLYIAMRFVEGTDLRSLLAQEERLDPSRAAGVVAQVASALDAAHERNLVHRDVKPANVLVAARGGGEHVYLTDFGLTKRSASESGLTAAGEWVGTLDYVAPEQLRGDHVDGRADGYALGCVLYETLTGSVPFPREDEVAKLWGHISDPAPSVLELAPDVPRRLDAAARKAMEKDPDDRFDRAGDLGRAALAAVPGGGDTGTRARAAASRARRGPRRRRGSRRGLLVGAAAVALAAGVTVAVVAGSGGEEGAGGQAPPAADVVASYAVGDSPTGVEVFADGLWVANSGDETVTFVDIRRPRTRQTIPVGEDPVALAAGPASIWVANFGDATVTRIDIGSRRPVATIPVGAAPVDLAAVTDVVWVATETDRIVRIDARTNTASPVARVESAGALELAANRLWVLDSASGTLRSMDARSGFIIDQAVALGRLPRDVAAGSSGAWVSVPGDGTLQRVPLVAPDVGARPWRARLGGRPEHLALDRRWLWVTDSDRETVARIDPSTGERVGRPVPVPEDPAGIAAGQGDIWVTSAGRDRVTRLEPR